jgi:hypothetical protein
MMQEEFRECIAACYRCADACDHCATSCLREDDMAAMAACIHLDRFCAEACRTAASFMAKTSGTGHEGYVVGLCGLCAEICDDCADECEKHDRDHCKDCAEACRECAAACRKMAA